MVLTNYFFSILFQYTIYIHISKSVFYFYALYLSDLLFFLLVWDVRQTQQAITLLQPQVK